MNLSKLAALGLLSVSVMGFSNANAGDSIGETIADIYIDSIISYPTRNEIKNIIENGDAIVDYQTRPDVVNDRVRGAIGDRKLNDALERERAAKCEQSGLCQ